MVPTLATFIMTQTFETFRNAVLLTGFCAITSTGNATTLTYDRDQTLGGWNERVYSTFWQDLQPDVKNYIYTDGNGDLRGFGHPTSTVWLTSPEFVLAAGPITISSLYLMSGGGLAPSSESFVSASKSYTGWAGIALRDTIGNFVFTYSNPTYWTTVILTSEQLAPYVGQTLTLDFINMNNSSGDFLYVNRPITISGELQTSAVAVPEPSAILLPGLGFIGLMLMRRQRQHRQQPAQTSGSCARRVIPATD